MLPCIDVSQIHRAVLVLSSLISRSLSNRLYQNECTLCKCKRWVVFYFTITSAHPLLKSKKKFFSIFFSYLSNSPIVVKGFEISLRGTTYSFSGAAPLPPKPITLKNWHILFLCIFSVPIQLSRSRKF